MAPFVSGRNVRIRLASLAAVVVALVWCGGLPAQAAVAPSPGRAVVLVDFQTAQVVQTGGAGVLVVSGVTPCPGVDVALVARTYVVQPEYWGIEVTAVTPGSGSPAGAPYTVSIPLDGITGTRGIEVVGARSTRFIDVP